MSLENEIRIGGVKAASETGSIRAPAVGGSSAMRSGTAMERGATGPQGPQGPKGDTGATGPAGADGISVTHRWNGTVLEVSSASGTSSADLKGEPGAVAGVKVAGVTHEPDGTGVVDLGDLSGGADLSDAAPADLGTAAAGTSELAARADHVHKMPTAAQVGAATAEEVSALKNDIAPLIYNNAGAHNTVYRGKNLGTSVTAAQWAAIADGTFTDMYIGDYWTIGGVTYRIAAFDYYYRAGDTACQTHHVTLVPAARMSTHAMNDTNVTTGAYVGSKMYKEGLTQAKNTINAAFGTSHILNHRLYLQNAVTDNYASSGSWYDSTVELMTEQNVYGCKIFGNMLNGTALPNSYTVDKSQYPLFKFRPDMISNHEWFWLRDVVSDTRFALVNAYGHASYDVASQSSGVRPAFSIC